MSGPCWRVSPHNVSVALISATRSCPSSSLSVIRLFCSGSIGAFVVFVSLRSCFASSLSDLGSLAPRSAMAMCQLVLLSLVAWEAVLLMLCQTDPRFLRISSQRAHVILIFLCVTEGSLQSVISNDWERQKLWVVPFQLQYFSHPGQRHHYRRNLRFQRYVS